MKGKRWRTAMLALAILTAVPLGAFPAYGTKTEVQEEEKKKSTLEEEKKKVVKN